MQKICFRFLQALCIFFMISHTRSTNKKFTRTPAEDQLIDYLKEHNSEEDILTTETGTPVDDVTSVLTVGKRGPMLVENVDFFEELFHFNRKKIPGRVGHEKGAGAFGYFVVTNDVITRYSKASVFSQIGKKTPIFVRFSGTNFEKGSADTVRDAKGYAIKFYTEDGIWDLVGSNSPVFFIRDPALVFSLYQMHRRNPVTNLFDLDQIWDFYTLRPETTYQILIHYSDRGTPDGYRHMHGFGTNTYKLVNAQNQPMYCKFHWKTNQGFKNLTADVAKKLMMEDPDYATRDLYNAIAEKRFPSWTFYVQVITFEQAERFEWNPFDVTKIWPEDKYPLIEVGKLELNRNPSNHFAEVEQAAFSPSHMIPGIEPSPDKILQGRLLSYMDAQNYRLGANHLQLPINRPRKVKVVNRFRDGTGTYTDNQGGRPNYFPSSFHNYQFNPNAVKSLYNVCGDVSRYNSSDDDNYSQPSIFWRKELNEDDRLRLIHNLVDELKHVSPFIQERAVKNFRNVDVRFSKMLTAALV